MNNEELISSLSKIIENIPEEIISKAGIHNPWFTYENIELTKRNWVDALNANTANEWIKNISVTANAKSIGVIMAGNIPMVGLHDALCVLATGNNLYAKLSSNDEVLMKYILQEISRAIPQLSSRINLVEQLNDIQALIATGSNNSARYFEYYFKDIPCIIRKNRTSLAILNGLESTEELTMLADDIYNYFGLGCRNVSHVIFPQNYEMRLFYEALDKYINIVNHHKYYNNYMYHKAILLMNLTKHYDNGMTIFQNKKDLYAPPATINYHFYNSIEEIDKYIATNEENIQCIASNFYTKDNWVVKLGNTQKTSLSDYADRVNTISFLEKLIV